MNDKVMLPFDPPPEPSYNDEFRTSRETDKLDEAMAKAQAEVVAASKDKTNPHFRSKYADLASIWHACREALTKHGVSITQWPAHSEDKRLHMITRLAHKGQWIVCRYSIPVGKDDVQGHGSAITYARRYTLAAAVGVAPDDDDDGNAAVSGDSKAKPPKRAPSAMDKLRASVSDRYAKLGGKAWKPWSDVVAAAEAEGNGQSAEALRKINEYLKGQLSDAA